MNDNHSTQRDFEVDAISGGLQEKTNMLGEDFRSPLNSNSRENSKMTAETVKVTSSQSTSQMAKKIDKIKID